MTLYMESDFGVFKLKKKVQIIFYFADYMLVLCNQWEYDENVNVHCMS